ncbi:MAG: LL-diaminopimelate aminotransferase [Oscillospiraceae bacterium]|nr:LL-diaminopimelate aminotransferase [Oscillospiraceae bacterium]
MKINSNYLNLKDNYLFKTVKKKVNDFILKNPGKKIINLGIGDVTLPICKCAVDAANNATIGMGRAETFKGYGPDGGYEFLREKIAEKYYSRSVKIKTDEIFVSDGAKSDISGILDIFSLENVCLVPDPVYPVYSDSNIMDGRQIVYLNANEENEFLPLPEDRYAADIIYICSPNNPTGSVYTAEMLKKWVNFANSNDSIILFDAAYEAFISEKKLPHSIFEIEGSKTCAIEINSFSKSAGFTGMRCAYMIIPHELVREGVSINKLWGKRISVKFNGVSYVIQRAAESVLTNEGNLQCKNLLTYYRENARITSSTLRNSKVRFFGGENSPYIWMKCPENIKSWDFFDYLLENFGVVGVPGSGFGKNGEGYFRFTTFGKREDINEAARIIGGVFS